MRTVAEEVDGTYYIDVIFTPEEAAALMNGRILENYTLVKKKRFHVGVRVGDEWVYDENKNGFLQALGE